MDAHTDFQLGLAQQLINLTNTELEARQLTADTNASINDILSTRSSETGESFSNPCSDSLVAETKSKLKIRMEERKNILQQLCDCCGETSRSSMDSFYAPADTADMFSYCQNLIWWLEDNRKHLLALDAERVVLQEEKKQRVIEELDKTTAGQNVSRQLADFERRLKTHLRPFERMQEKLASKARDPTMQTLSSCLLRLESAQATVRQHLSASQKLRPSTVIIEDRNLTFRVDKIRRGLLDLHEARNSCDAEIAILKGGVEEAEAAVARPVTPPPMCPTLISQSDIDTIVSRIVNDHFKEMSADLSPERLHEEFSIGPNLQHAWNLLQVPLHIIDAELEAVNYCTDPDLSGPQFFDLYSTQ